MFTEGSTVGLLALWLTVALVLRLPYNVEQTQLDRPSHLFVSNTKVSVMLLPVFCYITSLSFSPATAVSIICQLWLKINRVFKILLYTLFKCLLKFTREVCLHNLNICSSNPKFRSIYCGLALLYLHPYEVLIYSGLALLYLHPYEVLIKVALHCFTCTHVKCSFRHTTPPPISYTPDRRFSYLLTPTRACPRSSDLLTALFLVIDVTAKWRRKTPPITIWRDTAKLRN